MIVGMGAYHPSGVVHPGLSEPLHIPGDTDLTGAGVRETLEHLVATCSQDPEAFTWVGLVNPTRPELQLVAEIFSLESLQVEDAANTHQRAKFDVGEDGRTFCVVKVLDYEDQSGEVETGQISIFTGPQFAVTVRHGKKGDLSGVRARLEASEALRPYGPISVLYAVLDMVVDGYLAVSDEVIDDVNEVESQIFSGKPEEALTRKVYELKRENMEIRRAVLPLNAAAHRFANESADEIPLALRPYFRDVGEHVLRVSDGVDSTDSLLMTMLMASTALQDLQQNRDMRKISAYAAMGIVPTAIAGIYGMNFDNMPELSWGFGYPMALGIMALVMFLLYRAFKKSGWL
ncbi:MAG: hypothetical protein RJB01_1698 [Actinomycetota bacterium]|jgi:magnesium transporter